MLEPCLWLSVASDYSMNPKLGWRAHRPSLLKTLATVHGPTLCRFEGDCGLLPALGTRRLGFSPLKAGTVARGIRTLGFARLAPLGFVLETLVGEKHLFAGGENELSPTLRTL
jgi:hypothetical protein